MARLWGMNDMNNHPMNLSEEIKSGITESSPWPVKPGHFGSSSENIHIIKNFIEKEDVNKIINFSRNITEWSNSNDKDEFDENGRCIYNAEYWRNRQCDGVLIEKMNPEIYNLIDLYIHKMAKTIESIFNVRVSIRPPCIIRWFPGLLQEPHADKQTNDGQPNPFVDYDINSLFYYNDDFEGGELYYPQHGISIKPEPGMAVLHPGDINYLHGVSEIKSGERFTTPAFYSIMEFLK